MSWEKCHFLKELKKWFYITSSIWVRVKWVRILNNLGLRRKKKTHMIDYGDHCTKSISCDWLALYYLSLFSSLCVWIYMSDSFQTVHVLMTESMDTLYPLLSANFFRPYRCCLQGKKINHLVNIKNKVLKRASFRVDLICIFDLKN